MTRILYFQPLFLVFKPSMLFVQLLGHMSHDFQVLVERLLSYQWVFIILFFLQRFRLQCYLMFIKFVFKFLPHLIFLDYEILDSMLFQGLNLLTDEIHIHPGIFDSFLFRKFAIKVLLVCCIAVLLCLRIGIILSDPNVDILHLELILTLSPNSFEWLLTNPVDLVLQTLDHLSIFLLSEDVVLLLFIFGLI